MMNELASLIEESLSQVGDRRKIAEIRLLELQKLPEFSLRILQLVATPDIQNPALRQAAAVNFKNTIKKGWDAAGEDGNDGIVIPLPDRVTIKSHLVQLMCTVPTQIQSQLSESISLIAAVDFPHDWENLLPELVQQFQSSDPAVIVGVLRTANSIFKAFRYVQRSDALYAKIKFSLSRIQEPLLALFISIGQAVRSNNGDKLKLQSLFEALRLVCRIVYSLNYQDLPEFFEDHFSEWMGEYSFYLEYNNAILADEDEEVEPSVLDNVKVAIITNLSLYASKDEECFMEYLPKFTTMVWNLLMKVTSFSKHDMLTTKSIQFLSSLLIKEMHRQLFNNESILREIVLKIVIPNLLFRESDQERFEDDPKEYMLTEIEGSDSESRRKCSQDLLKAMCRNFETETTKICLEQAGNMLIEYNQNPETMWAAKDAAIHLMIGITIRRESAQGVSEVNPEVKFDEFFQSHIGPELSDNNYSARPVLKASAIKFVAIFRNQFDSRSLTQIFPVLIAHLSSPIVVVHTFACYTIERILVTREDANVKSSKLKFGGTNMQPFIQPLFNGLFAITDNNSCSENEYCMKCIMRALATVSRDVVPVVELVTIRLTDTLARVSKNPQNPQFNHYLFESISVLVQSVCSSDHNATILFENLLFVPFNQILQQDISEFTPYVFQVLAQLLEFRPVGSGLGEAYSQLFPPLLTPSLWEKKGNVPALCRLIQAYMEKAASDLVSKLNPVLGVFQKLIASKATEVSAFEILSSIISHFPFAALEPFNPTIFQLLLIRLQNSKTPRYTRLVSTLFALFVGKHGSRPFLLLINSIQPNLATMLITQVWSPRLIEDPPQNKIDAKVNIVGATKLLCEDQLLLVDKIAWGQLFVSVITLLTSSTFKTTSTESSMEEAEIDVSYDALFSQLVFARKAVEDPFLSQADPTFFFVESVHALISRNPGQMRPLVQAVTSDPKLSTNLENLFNQMGFTLF